VLLNGDHGAAMAEQCGGFLDNHHRQFVKGCLPWRHHRLQWRVYMADVCPSVISAIDSNLSVIFSNLEGG